MSKNLISKKHFKIIQFIFILACLINFVNSAFTEDSMKATLIAGVGIGTFAIMIAIVIGIGICIFGLAFPNPGLFVFIGILIPVIVFIFFAFCPTESVNKNQDPSENTTVNVYIVARVTHFVIMFVLLAGLLGPAFILWGMQIIPQRVDSSSQRDFYDDNYLEAIEKQKKRKYNLEETDVLLPQRLPLGINRRNNNKNNFIRNSQNNQNSSLIQNNSQNNASNNLIDNINGENSNEFPQPILPRAANRNELNENRKKFTGLIRRKAPK